MILPSQTGSPIIGAARTVVDAAVVTSAPGCAPSAADQPAVTCLQSGGDCAAAPAAAADGGEDRHSSSRPGPAGHTSRSSTDSGRWPSATATGCTCSPASCATSPQGSPTLPPRSPSSTTSSSTANSSCGGPAGSTSPRCRTDSAPAAPACTASSRRRRRRTSCSTCSPATARICATGPTGSGVGSWRSSSARGLPDGLVLTPATTDPAVARTWMLAHTGTGLEGVVAKRLDQPYRPGRRGWQKLRTRITAEAVVGGITGPLEAPQELILGRHDDTGRLRIAGRTTRLRSPTAAPARRAPRGAGPRLARTAARAQLGRTSHRLHPRPPRPGRRGVRRPRPRRAPLAPPRAVRPRAGRPAGGRPRVAGAVGGGPDPAAPGRPDSASDRKRRHPQARTTCRAASSRPGRRLRRRRRPPNPPRPTPRRRPPARRRAGEGHGQPEVDGGRVTEHTPHEGLVSLGGPDPTGLSLSPSRSRPSSRPGRECRSVASLAVDAPPPNLHVLSARVGRLDTLHVNFCGSQRLRSPPATQRLLRPINTCSRLAATTFLAKRRQAAKFARCCRIRAGSRPGSPR